MSRQPIYVGILGYGKIGTGTYKTLLDNQDSIDRKVGRPVRVKRLVDVELGRRPGRSNSGSPLR